MRRTTTGSAAPIKAATTTATPIARAVSSRSGFRCVTTPEGGLSCGTLWRASLISVSQDSGEDPVQLGEVLVADLERTAAARIPERDLGAQLALQLLDQVADLRAGVAVALLLGRALRLEPLHQRLGGAHREVLGDHLFGGAPQVALVGDGEYRARV